jgi:hypothetical protein
MEYSLLIDEGSDISVTKLMGIVIRYYSQSRKCIVVTCLDLMEPTSCTADSICKVLKSCVKGKGLNFKKRLAIVIDNASVMFGVNNGIYSKVKADLPHWQLARCLCHSFQLAILYAAAECFPRNLEFLIKETYFWFSHSAL